MTTPTFEVGNLQVDGSVSGLAVPIIATAITALSSTGMVNGQSVYTSGLNAANDGGGGWFNWYSTAPGTADGGILITPASGGGQYVRQGWTVFGFNGYVSILWFGADPSGTSNSAAAINNALAAYPGATVYAKKGTYLCSTPLNFLGWYGTFVGDGIDRTVFKATASVTSLFNLYEASDTVVSPVVLRGFTINGNSLATNGYNLQYRHQTSFENLRIINCTNGGQEKNSWINRRSNVRYESNTINLFLAGSNHNSHWERCSFTGSTSSQLLVQLGSDGNCGLCFTACDIEFGAAGGVGADITCTDLTFNSCYLGESIYADVIINRGGVININGGSMFFGLTTSSYLVNPIAGKTVFRACAINGQTNGSTTYLARPSTGTGKFAFYDCPGAVTVGGNQYISGDPLDYGPQGNVFAPRLGRNYAGQVYNGTLSSSTTASAQTVTLATSTGSPCILGMSASTINPSTWRTGEPVYLLLVYRSTKPLNIYLSTGAFNGTTLMGSTPASSSTTFTYVKIDTPLPASLPLLEINQQSSVVGDTMTIYECVLSDSRMLNAGTASFSNLYKC